jgi:hypothetical protein
MKKIFLSYRRTDSADTVDRITQYLARTFGNRCLFRDIESIALGENFARAIDRALDRSSVVLAIIGRDWINESDAAGRRRLDNPDDFVRQEIAAALKSSKLVIPVIVQNAEVPRSHELPESLRELSKLQAARVRPEPDFTHDMVRLCEQISLHTGLKPQRRVRNILVSAVVVALAAGTALPLVKSPSPKIAQGPKKGESPAIPPPPPKPSEPPDLSDSISEDNVAAIEPPPKPTPAPTPAPAPAKTENAPAPAKSVVFVPSKPTVPQQPQERAGDRFFREAISIQNQPGRSMEARDLLTQAIALQTTWPEAYLYRARLNLKIEPQPSKNVQADYDNYLRLKPISPEVRKEYEDYLDEHGYTNKARDIHRGLTP